MVSRVRINYSQLCRHQCKECTNTTGLRQVQVASKHYLYKAHSNTLNLIQTLTHSCLGSSRWPTTQYKAVALSSIAAQARLQMCPKLHGKRGSVSCSGKKTNDGIRGGDLLSKAKDTPYKVSSMDKPQTSVSRKNRVEPKLYNGQSQEALINYGSHNLWEMVSIK